MEGQYLQIGGRRTYFPPYVHERFGDPPYWACTFTSLLNGANVGWLGKWPANSNEVRALAKASGDVDTRGGSRSSHMITAMRVRYGRRMAIESLPPSRVKERLANGWALVGAVTYGNLPELYRRPSPRFKGGHRIVLIGWDDGRTRILDPMQMRDHTYTGQWIRWSDFEPAWWSAEQLWFREGMALTPPITTVLATFKPERRWAVKAGTVVAGRSPSDPREIVRHVRLAHDSGARFDAWVEVKPSQPGAAALGRYIRVTSGGLDGLLIDPKTPGVRADTRTVIPPSAPTVAPASPVTRAPSGATAADVALAARRTEYERLKKLLDKGDGTFPPFV
jgi:hypothetical protein